MGRFYRMIVLMALWIPQQVRAQAIDCEQTIALATAEFDAGHFHSVPSILSECLTNFNRNQRQRAFLLLTQTYLLLDDPIGAQKSYLEVLSANPEFIPDEQLHAIDVVYLSKRFTATPKFSWFVGGGSNVSPAKVIRDLYIAKSESQKYYLRTGYQFGAGAEYSYDDNIKMRLEVNYLHTTYRSRATGSNKGGVETRKGDTESFIDRQTWINVPLYVCYADNIGTYRPYAYAGFSISRLLSDRASIIRDDNTSTTAPGEEATESTFTKESPDYDFTARRNQFNKSLIFGGGVKYKVGLDFVFAELRYCVGLKNIVNPETRLANYGSNSVSVPWLQAFAPAAEYGYTDDYLRLDNILFTVGFLRPLYKPRELKRVRTKGVLRKMKKAK